VCRCFGRRRWQGSPARFFFIAGWTGSSKLGRRATLDVGSPMRAAKGLRKLMVRPRQEFRASTSQTAVAANGVPRCRSGKPSRSFCRRLSTKAQEIFFTVATRAFGPCTSVAFGGTGAHRRSQFRGGQPDEDFATEPAVGLRATKKTRTQKALSLIGRERNRVLPAAGVGSSVPRGLELRKGFVRW